MIKDLVDLQRYSKATCVIIKSEDLGELYPAIAMKANISDEFLLTGDMPPFAEKIEPISKLDKLCYFIITGIDEISVQQQNRFVGLVKDREFKGYYLPDNCVIVFTVKDRLALKKVSPELYHFAVVAF